MFGYFVVFAIGFGVGGWVGHTLVAGKLSAIKDEIVAAEKAAVTDVKAFVANLKAKL